MSESLIDAGGGWQVNNGEDLYEAMNKLMEDTELQHRMGRLAKEFVDNNQGALGRVVSYIGDSMKGPEV
jgi:3-deoxy-D-manno-octulosonic-acid transferase